MLFNNKRITNLENQIAELTARLARLESSFEHLELRVEDKLDGIFDGLEEKLDEAVESYDFSDAAREALGVAANEATFTINF